MKKLIKKTEVFLKNMRWKTFWFEKKGNSNEEGGTQSHRREITAEFKSTKTPPQNELLKPFERDIYTLIGNIEFCRVNDPALQKLGEEAKRIKNSNMVIVNADKTGNKYEMSAEDYKQASINRDTKSHAKTMEIDDRMECHSEANAFLTIKNHKDEFLNKIKCRVINPASNNLGKVSKRILDKINTKCREATRVNQWRSTQDVLQWFSGVHAANPTKKKAKFLQFDINEFYPSISEELLRNSIRFAKNHATIEQGEEDLIMACRKSILFNDGRAWTKKEKNFDVTMGAQDGAEIAELTGIYLLQQINKSLSKMEQKAHAGLYRDDGLIYIEDANGPLINRIEKTLHRIFKNNKLSISLEQNGLVVNFLDVTMDTDGIHKPYRKPNSKITYFSRASNHPPSITKNIPRSIGKRLNTISSSEAEFNNAKDDYQHALNEAGYTVISTANV